MKYTFFLAIAIWANYAVGQTIKLKELSINQVFIWNKTTIYDIYSGARASNKSGNARSNGTNFSYSLGLNEKVFATAGIGYFNQSFGIQRGFDFYEPNVVTGLFYTTKKYSYKSFNYFGGIGYRIKGKAFKSKVLLKKSEIRFSAIAQFYSTFQQDFQHDFGGNFLGNPNPQVRKSKYYYGSSLYLKGAIVRPIYKNFLIGLEFVIPAYNRLRKDVIFRENAAEYHKVNFSYGGGVNIIYNLKN